MEKNIIEYEGTVVFLKANTGSKSESVVPHIYIDKDNIVPAMKENDNPFENSGLLEYDGKKVRISGYQGRGNTFIVTEVNNLSDIKGEN